MQEDTFPYKRFDTPTSRCLPCSFGFGRKRKKKITECQALAEKLDETIQLLEVKSRHQAHLVNKCQSQAEAALARGEEDSARIHLKQKRIHYQKKRVLLGLWNNFYNLKQQLDDALTMYEVANTMQSTSIQLDAILQNVDVERIQHIFDELQDHSLQVKDLNDLLGEDLEIDITEDEETTLDRELEAMQERIDLPSPPKRKSLSITTPRKVEKQKEEEQSAL